MNNVYLKAKPTNNQVLNEVDGRISNLTRVANTNDRVKFYLTVENPFVSKKRNGEAWVRIVYRSHHLRPRLSKVENQIWMKHKYGLMICFGVALIVVVRVISCCGRRSMPNSLNRIVPLTHSDVRNQHADQERRHHHAWNGENVLPIGFPFEVHEEQDYQHRLSARDCHHSGPNHGRARFLDAGPVPNREWGSCQNDKESENGHIRFRTAMRMIVVVMVIIAHRNSLLI